MQRRTMAALGLEPVRFRIDPGRRGVPATPSQCAPHGSGSSRHSLRLRPGRWRYPPRIRCRYCSCISDPPPQGRSSRLSARLCSKPSRSDRKVKPTARAAGSGFGLGSRTGGDVMTGKRKVKRYGSVFAVISWSAFCLALLSPAYGGGTTGGVQQFRFEFNASMVNVDHDPHTGYDHIRCEGLSSFTSPRWPGSPALPALQRTVLLPEGMRVASLSVLPQNPVLVAEDIQPFPGPVPGSEQEEEPSPEFYGPGGSFPPRFELLTTNNAYREFRLAHFVAFPLEWRANGGRLFLYRTLKVSISLEAVDASEAPPRRLRPERRLSRGHWELEWIRQHVMNPGDLDLFYEDSPQPSYAVAETTHATGFDPTERPSLQGTPVDMVIVTGGTWPHGDIAGDMTVPFQRWADWRTKTGIPTVVRTIDWIRARYSGGDDQEKIRKFLEEAYSLWGTDFVLLGGDHELVPSRQAIVTQYPFPKPTDPPSDWYYAGLDSDWNDPYDAYYDWYYEAVDAYPELWVGRLPARDSTEAAAIVDKLMTYERVPGLGLAAPPDSFYTKALLAAGITLHAGWDDTYQNDEWNFEKSWDNGMYQSEFIKNTVLDSLQLTSVRMYPYLPDSADCGSGTKLACYGDIMEGVENYPWSSDLRFTALNVRDRLNSDDVSLFFHFEHSGASGLGGPTNSTHAMPVDSVCSANSPPCTDCSSWADDCYEDYLANNTFGGIGSDLSRTLSNGPSYFVGCSRGCSTGRFELDSVLESLVRDPDGGAVAMWGKAVSTEWKEYDGPQVDSLQVCPAIAPRFLDYALLQQEPIGVGLYNAILDNAENQWSKAAHLQLHLFGDPSLMVWSAAPDSLDVTTNINDMPDFWQHREVLVTVKDDGVAVSGARVCLEQSDDIYALTWTGDDGVAQFPAVHIHNLEDDLNVWTIAHNYLPGEVVIDNLSNVIPPSTLNPPLFYSRHVVSDSLDPGETSDVIEAGDLVDLDVTLRNPMTDASPPGLARLGMTPRVKAALEIASNFEPDSIFIGKEGAHPPAGADTFSLLINEYAIRPE
ncbi:MAG: hypothetical protein GF355_06005, partial [Candidatus Eisenbacteria bacterium]|nr:hypothetical protein [Candidatus Eisenbacteria bacterium]